jgi:uncharacterized repeat protein (TIGR01451 family)
VRASAEVRGPAMRSKIRRHGAVQGRALIASALVAFAIVLACGGAALAAGPVWRVDPLSDTTAAPGDTLEYTIEVANVGDTATSSDFTLTINFPSGLTGVGGSGGGFSCSGTITMTCTNSDTLNPHGFEILTVDATVDPSASGLLTTTLQMTGGGAPDLETADPTTITTAAPSFGVDAFDGQVTADAAGAPYTQAGGHPFAASTDIDFNTMTNANPLIGPLWPVEPAKDAHVDLPPGFIGNPTAAAKCAAADLANAQGVVAEPLCSPASQVGTALVRLNGFGGPSVFGPLPVFNVVPPPNVPARFGFNVAGTVVTLNGALRSDSDYGLSVHVDDIPEGLAISGTSLTFWGVPADVSHDAERACPGQQAPWQGGSSCSTDAPRVSFLRNPTSCTPAGVGLPTTLSIDSWVHPGDFKQATFFTHLPPAYPFPPPDQGPQQGPTGCDNVPFDPSLSATPGTPAKANSPSGFTFDLKLPQNGDPASIGEADLKRAVVQLPVGVRVSPSSADGLGACTPDEIGLHSLADPSCPGSSKLGSIVIDTPLLDQPLTGSVYLAAPHDNPFGSLLAIYLVAKGPGLIVKLPGKVDADPQTGQLTATFDNNPQLPFMSLHLAFDGGPRAALVTPKQCGTYTTHAELTSWSGKTVSSDSSFSVSGDGNGGACAPATFSPGFTAGTQNPVAGADSPFLLQLTRGDQDQELSGLTVYTPSGLLGRIANAVLCPAGAANAGTCQDVSKIGDVTVGAGAGSNPFYITNGRAYITGPYKGAPYGLSIVVPAVAGPFDLGDVVVRAAIFVDRATAALRVVSDPLPTILQGIPLDVRDVRVAIDKPHFIVNPTSCAVKHVFGTIASTQGAIAHASSRFQVGDCASLSLAPRLSLTVGARRHTRAGVSTPVTATLTQTRGQANLRSVSVALPGTLDALLPVVNRACDRSAFDAGRCTNATKVGSAVAVTPLLRDPLRGSAYFVKTSPGHLPNLMVALRGQIAIDLKGVVSIPGGRRLATTFNTIPDAPITKFTLRIVSGRNGPVGIATNLCSAKGRSTPARLGFRGQNGKLVQLSQRVRVIGCSKARPARKAARTRR